MPTELEAGALYSALVVLGVLCLFLIVTAFSIFAWIRSHYRGSFEWDEQGAQCELRRNQSSSTGSQQS